MNRQTLLRTKITVLTWVVIVGLIIAGVTAIPLESELRWLSETTGAREAISAGESSVAPDWAVWLVRVEEAIGSAADEAPFLFYGTDWLAFGHFVIAIGFIGALRDPARNRWLFQWGLIACVLVVPFAFVFGGIRGIPVWWRLIDCSFGVFGAIPLWLCHIWSRELDGNT